jgi:SAM-dependent methyltransferase
MIAIARERAPSIRFEVGSMLQLPASDGAWSGIVALYSMIHLSPDERVTACREFARVLRPGGWLLVAFHTCSVDYAAGEARHVTEWFGQSVDLQTFFLDPADVVADLEASEFAVVSTVNRQPWPGANEYPSRRSYLLCQRISSAP